MPNVLQPTRLEALALRRLGDWVALQAESLMSPITCLSRKDTDYAKMKVSKKVSQIRIYLQYNVPWILYNLLAIEVIRAINELLEQTKQSMGFRGSMAKFVNQMNVAISMTEVVFTKYITMLAIDSIPKMMRSVFYKKLYMFTGLQYLNLGSLSGGWKTADMEPTVIECIRPLHQLRDLCINYDCTNNILKCIQSNCPFIAKLDVSCSKSIDNESIDIIAHLKQLRSIQLYRTSVSLEGFTKLLLKCSNLEDIGRCDEIGKVLEYVHITNSEAGPFALTNFVSRYAPAHHLQLAVEMCPRIRKMTVFHNNLQSDLLTLISLSELSELKLLSCDFYGDQVKQVLQVKGCNISTLHLEHVEQIDLNALMYVSQLCPMLENFTLYNCTLIQHTSLYTKKLDILPFRNLQRLTCVSVCTTEQIMFMLTNCLNVKYIQLGTAVQLTDEILEQILQKNPMIYLEELRIMHSDFLTIRSVELIVNSCMSLKHFVELECWTALTENDRDYIKEYLKINNYNINIISSRNYITLV